MNPLAVEIGSRRWPGDHPIMDLERVFLNKLADLETRLTVPPAEGEDPEYRMLMMAPLLRELLFGTPTLINAANREHRLRFEFRFVDFQPLPEYLSQPSFRTMGNLAVEDYPPRMQRTFNLDGFLGAPVASVGGTDVSVRDVIDYTANAAGGVHLAGTDRGNRQRTQALDETIRFRGWSVAYVLLVQIGRTVVEALRPLVAKVRADYAR